MFYAKLDAILIKRQDIDNAVVFCQSKNLFFYRISLLHSVNLIVVTSKWMGPNANQRKIELPVCCSGVVRNSV